MCFKMRDESCGALPGSYLNSETQTLKVLTRSFSSNALVLYEYSPLVRIGRKLSTDNALFRTAAGIEFIFEGGQLLC
jgi:hypothetical protein